MSADCSGMSFAFGGVRANATKKDLAISSLDSPLMYKTGAGTVPIILGEYIPGKAEKLLGPIAPYLQDIAETYSDPSMPRPGWSYLSALRTKHSSMTAPLDKEITATYKRNKWDYSEFLQHMSDDCPFVFTAGRGLYAVTQSDELQSSFFYDIVFNKSYFYSPDLQKLVFPIDTLTQLMRRVRINFQAKGSWDTQITEYVRTGADPKTIVADVYQTNFAMHQLVYAFTHWHDLQEELEGYKSIPTPSTEIITDPQQISSILNRIQKDQWVAMDIETSGLDFTRDRIGDFTLALNSEVGYYFPWETIVANECCLSALHSAFQRANIIGANFKFDIKFMRRDLELRDPKKRDWGPKVLRVHDDIVQAGHVLNEMRFNSLKTLSWLYTPFGGYNRDLDEWKLQHPTVDSYLDIPDEIRIPYAGMDVAVTFAVAEQQLRQFETVVADIDSRDHEDGSLRPEQSMYHYYKTIMMGVVNSVADVEYRGINVDTDVQEQEYAFIEKKLSEIESEIRTLLAEDSGGVLPPFDVTSSDQLGVILEEAGWPLIKRNEKGNYSTEGASLEKWSYMGYKAAPLIQEYRSWAITQKTFIGSKAQKTGWWQHIREHEDGSRRMHAQFGPMRTNTGRNRCRNPNLQNIPAHGVTSKHAKRPLAPPPGCYISSIDYDAFQIKIATLQSKDPTLWDTYTSGRDVDIHSITAHKVFGDRKFDLIEVELYDARGKMHTVLGQTQLTVTRADGSKHSTTAQAYEQREGDTVEW